MKVVLMGCLVVVGMAVVRVLRHQRKQRRRKWARLAKEKAEGDKRLRHTSTAVVTCVDPLTGAAQYFEDGYGNGIDGITTMDLDDVLKEACVRLRMMAVGSSGGADNRHPSGSMAKAAAAIVSVVAEPGQEQCQ